jgi:hypothetical protein
MFRASDLNCIIQRRLAPPEGTSGHGPNAKLVYERGKKSVKRLVKIELITAVSGFVLPLLTPRWL